MSLSITIDASGLGAIFSVLKGMERPEYHELMDGLARLGASQTQRRIQSEKTSPAGAAWKKTRDGRGALFRSGSHLNDSIDHKSSGTQASWGSGWIGAGVHQFGAVIKPVKAKVLRFAVGGETVFARRVTIPARPYIGLSAANQKEMIETAERFLGKYVK